IAAHAMTSIRFLLLVGTALATSSGAAFAQTPAPAVPARAQAPTQTPPPAPAATPQEEAPAEDSEKPAEAAALDDVVVSARPNDIRTSSEGTSYSLANDLQAQTGTLAEALRNIPSVEVDPDGNVSLRGDPNVTILVDGRPASQFNGPSRGQLVQQIPASQYARIEILTNPSAAYSPEGSGGVINLISKPTTVRPGQTTTGSLRANVGDSGRYNVGGSLSHVNGPTTLSADFGVRHDAYLQELTRLRTRFDAGSGRFLEARQSQNVEGDSDSVFVRLAVEHNLDARTQLTGDVRHTDVDSFADSIDLYEADAAGGGIASAYRRVSGGGFQGQFSGASARILRRFDEAGHEWSNELRYDRNRFGIDFATLADRLIPVAAPFSEFLSNQNRQDQIGFTSAYVRPMADGGRLRLGYERQALTLDQDNLFARGATPAMLVADPVVSNEFRLDQTVHAVYATLERPFGDKLTAQFGLRLEQAELELNQVTTGLRSSQDYLRAYPTLNMSYQLDETQTLRASYGRRIQRPGPGDLNPFLTYQDNLNRRSGNPDLLPQETDALELIWGYRQQQTFYQATLYYRDTRDAFTPVTTDLGGGVFLTRPENLGASTSTGLELVASGALHPTLRYNATVNVFRQEIDAAGLVGTADSEGESVSGRLTLNWTPTQADFLQVSGVWGGEQLLAQGTREQSTLVNLGYRRKLSASWSLNVTVRDAFDDFGATTTIATPAFTDRSDQVFGGRAAFIGLTWNFGGGQRRPEQFDFAAPTTGG
ncbi:TonB-dependent receptor domain-containing protein, partial [Brevundimonas sp.]|uniref:TonB-dependent receptor domain-containing protein n=1 Tax=Brevundimonas sp. TaxID=1871086 RepID=UPI00286B8633